jgi:HK97 family phage major capsid protein
LNALQRAQAEHNAALADLERINSRIQALPDDAVLEAGTLKREYDAASERVEWARREHERTASIASARSSAPVPRISVGSEPATYRTGGSPQVSFVRDLLVTARPGQYNPLAVRAAEDRLRRNQLEALDGLPREYRDVTTADPGSASFIPPLYMGSEWIDKERAGRPLADAVRQMTLPAQGKQLDFPRTQTSPEADVQASEAAAVTETDFDSETYSVSKVTIAGQNDHSLQSLEWSQPGMDEVIIRELVKSYNSKLDAQMLHGSGSSGQHRGLRNVSGINSISFSSGDAAALVGKVYQGVSDISTNAPGYVPNAVVMHPRRAAWIAKHRDGSGNLLQQGGLFLAQGQQDSGFAGNIAGLGVILDPNIQTTLGTGTNEDEIYALALNEVILAEGPLQARVLTEVLSGTLQVRLQVFAFSAFAGGRRPKVVARISGAGLSSPSF